MYFVDTFLNQLTTKINPYAPPERYYIFYNTDTDRYREIYEGYDEKQGHRSLEFNYTQKDIDDKSVLSKRELLLQENNFANARLMKYGVPKDVFEETLSRLEMAEA